MIVSATPYAGLLTRAVALALDALLVQGSVLVVAGVLALAASLVGGLHFGTAEEAVAAAAWLLIDALYFVTCWSVSGQTPGMRLMHLRVTRTDGGPLRLGRATIRLVGLVLAIVPAFAGFLPVLFDDRRRGVHDWLAGTVVRFEDTEADAGQPSPEGGRLAGGPTRQVETPAARGR